MSSGERYGIDAPGMVRGLSIAAAACLLTWLAGRYTNSPAAVPMIAPLLFWPGVATGATAGWMLVSSLFLKHLVLRRLLDERRWRGDEAVLDIGCGRGLALVAAAKRLNAGGHATGVDLWLSRDLSGNTPHAALANAHAAGVADQVSVDTGDMRALPYANAHFDVVTSMTAIHNLPTAADRSLAVAELWRVLKPGGQALVYDLAHTRAYVRQLRALGATVRMRGPILLWAMPGWRFTATK